MKGAMCVLWVPPVTTFRDSVALTGIPMPSEMSHTDWKVHMQGGSLWEFSLCWRIWASGEKLGVGAGLLPRRGETRKAGWVQMGCLPRLQNLLCFPVFIQTRRLEKPSFAPCLSGWAVHVLVTGELLTPLRSLCSWVTLPLCCLGPYMLFSSRLQTEIRDCPLDLCVPST